MRETEWKRIISGLLAMVLVLGYVPATAFASEENGTCEHHPQHTETCGYSAAVEGHACAHEHTDACYETVTACVHVHGDCGYAPAVEGHGCECQQDENGEIVHTEGCGYVEAVAEVSCGHVCSEESGCVKQVLNCRHQHDTACGYAEAAAETPCGFVCEECAKEASGEPVPTEYYGGSEAEVDTTWGLRGASTFSLEGNSSDSLSSGFYRITTKLDREYKLTLTSSSYSCVTTGESGSQVFYVSQLENGYFVIYDSSKTSVVTALSSEFAKNTQMGLQEYSDIPQQHWAILPAKEDDGSYYIITAENDMFLDVDNATCEENAVVKLFPRNGLYDAQNWFFEPCENYGDSDNCSCLEQYAGNYVVSNTSEVTIRDGHSVASNALGRIPLGTEISITKASGAAGSSDAWGHVTYNGISGYINMAYVEQQIESLGSGNCGAEGSNVTWNLTNDGTLTISGSGAMKDYSWDANAPWYDQQSRIKTVVIKQGVTSIGQYALYKCEKLTSVTIPNSVTSIGDSAFHFCYSLTSVAIPNSVTIIGNYTFRYCDSLTSITIPSSVTSIGDFAFESCHGLTIVTILNSVSFIGNRAFCHCNSLTSVTIPSSVTSIGDYAFAVCSKLKDVYYNGTEAQWNQIVIGEYNSELTNANIHFNSNGISSELTLVSTSPAAGATNVALDEPLVLTFSQDISEQLDWSKGKIYIRNYETNEIAETIDATSYFQSGAHVENNKLILPINMRTDLFNASYSGKFYVVADAGIVCASDSGQNEISTWGGINQKDILTFSLKRNIIGGGFTPGRDTFNFSNTDTYFGKGNNIQLLPTHHHLLASKLGIVDQLIIDTAILFNNISGKFMGNCFGMSALMGLLYTNKLSLDGMQKDARCVFDLNKPKSDENIRSYLSYYQLLQYIVVPTDKNIGSEQEESQNMVRTLLNGKSPVMLSVKIIGDDGEEGEHEVLAFAIDADIDSDHYVVYFADPNQMIVPDTIDGQLIEPLKMRPANSALFISKDDYSYSGAIVSGSGKHMNKSSIKSVYYSIIDLSVFDTLSIESSDTYFGQKLDSFLATACRDFSLINVESGEEIVVQDGHIVHGEGLHGPYSTVWGNDTGNLAYYFFDSENEWEFVPLESKTQLTLVGFTQAEKAIRAESNAKSIRFSPSGRVSFSEASSQSKLCITQNKVDSDVFAFSLTTDASDISLTPQADGSFKVESEEPIGNITVESINPTHDAGSVTENVSGTSAIATPVQNDQYEIIESNNYTIEVGANGRWQKGSKQELAFESNGPVDKFQKLVLDGADLAVANYTVSEKSGNTAVSLKAEYLQTLDTGEHSLYFSFTDGKTSDISFTVEELFNRLDLSPYDDFNNQTEIFIDGVPYPIESSNGRCVNIPRDAGFATSYQIHNSNSDDVHLRYPEGMMVYRIVRSDDGIAKLEKIDAFTNLLQYSGSSIRITGKKGIRMITSLTKSAKAALTSRGLAGFTLVEYGTALCWARDLEGDKPLVLGQDYVKSNYAYKKGVADPVFANPGNLTQYTNVLVGFTLDQCADDIAMRPYIKLLDENGEEVVIYGGIVYRSIGYIAYQNRNAFQPKSAAYNYVWEIIHHVYGNKYDADYKG